MQSSTTGSVRVVGGGQAIANHALHDHDLRTLDVQCSTPCIITAANRRAIADLAAFDQCAATLMHPDGATHVRSACCQVQPDDFERAIDVKEAATALAVEHCGRAV